MFYSLGLLASRIILTLYRRTTPPTPISYRSGRTRGWPQRPGRFEIKVFLEKCSSVISFQEPLDLADPKLVQAIWKPEVFFPNAKEGDFQFVTMPNLLIRIHPDGEILYILRYISSHILSQSYRLLFFGYQVEILIFILLSASGSLPFTPFTPLKYIF